MLHTRQKIHFMKNVFHCLTYFSQDTKEVVVTLFLGILNLKGKTSEVMDFIKTNFAAKSLKVVSATFLLVCFSSPKESTCETWKKKFFFTPKALVVLEKIRF